MTERTRRGRGADRDAASGGRPITLNRRTLLGTAAGGAVAAPLAGCLDSLGAVGSGGSDRGPVRVGVLAPDPQSDFIGMSMARSAEVAVDELNEGDGIDGREVELVLADTKQSPLEARRAYQRLVLEEDVDVTVGVFDSPALVNVLDDIAEQETLHLTSGAATQVASRRVHEEYDRYKYHFRVGPTNDADLGRAQLNFMAEFAPEIGWDSIAVLAEDYPWADVPWEMLEDDLSETPVDVVYRERYPPAMDDFSDIYADIAAEGADAAFVMAAHTGTDALLDWTRQQPFAFGGIHVPMQLPSYYEQTDGACRYGLGYSTATAQSRITENTQHFVGRYHDAYGSYPQDMGYNTYDAVSLFAHAAETAGTVDSDELIPVLEDVSFTGASGIIEFYEPEHVHAHDFVYDPETPTGIYFQWQENDAGEGVREVIWPEKHATSEYVAPPWLE